jgi:hypothetical protein
VVVLIYAVAITNSLAEQISHYRRSICRCAR